MPGEILLHFHRPPLEELLVCDLGRFLHWVKEFRVGRIRWRRRPLHFAEFPLLPTPERRLRRSGEIGDRNRELPVVVAREVDAYDTLG